MSGPVSRMGLCLVTRLKAFEFPRLRGLGIVPRGIVHRRISSEHPQHVNSVAVRNEPHWQRRTKWSVAGGEVEVENTAFDISVAYDPA